MTCSNSNPNLEQFRRVLRLALSVSLLSGSALASDKVLSGNETGVSVEGNPISSSRMVLVQRWLGLGQRIGQSDPNRELRSSSAKPLLDGNTHLPHAFPFSPPAPTPSGSYMGEACPPIAGPISEFAGAQVQRLQPLTIGLPAFDGGAESGSSQVVTASATQNSESVVESLSDQQDVAPPSRESVDPVDLMNSLELDPAGRDETSTSLNLSDRGAASSADDQASVSRPQQPRLREPQIVGTHKPLLLRSARPAQTIPSPSERIGAQDQSFEPALQSTDLLDRESAQPSKISSRRGFRPEPMKIQILGQQNPNRQATQKTQREPLVAMLANYPLEPKSTPSDKQSGSLKEMIQADRDTSTQESSDSSEPIVSSVEQTIEDQTPKLPEKTLDLDAKVVDTDQHFNVGTRESIPLKCENTIQGVSIEKEDICQVIQTGPRSYTLIGLNEGVTRFALITEVSGESQIEIHQATVNNRAGGPDLESLAESMDQTVRQLYPTSRVTVEAMNQRILVKGRVDSEESARKIIGLIRKTALAPVVDQLTTY